MDVVTQFINTQSEASLLPEGDHENLVKSMSIYIGAGMDEESAFDKAWADTVGF